MQRPDPLHGYTYQFRPGRDGRAFLLLHGIGGDETDMNQIGELLAPDSAWLSPRGKVIADGHARYMTRRADASFDPEEVRRETADLAAFIQEATRRHELTDAPFVAIGYSNGANMIASLLGHQPDILDAAVLFRGMLPIELPDATDLPGTPTLLLNGSEDHIMAHGRVEALADYLRRHGAAVTQHWLPVGHPLSAYDVALTERWLTALNT